MKTTQLSAINNASAPEIMSPLESQLKEQLGVAQLENEELQQIIFEQNRQISWLMSAVTPGSTGNGVYEDILADKLIRFYGKARSNPIRRLLWRIIPELRSTRRLLRKQGRL